MLTKYCEGCSKVVDGKCSIYQDISWVERRGGCPINFKIEVVMQPLKRMGQQKGKKSKKSFIGTYYVKRGRKSRRAGL